MKKRILMTTTSKWDGTYIVQADTRAEAAEILARHSGRTVEYIKANYTPQEVEDIPVITSTETSEAAAA